MGEKEGEERDCGLTFPFSSWSFSLFPLRAKWRSCTGKCKLLVLLGGAGERKRGSDGRSGGLERKEERRGWDGSESGLEEGKRRG